MSRLPHEEIAKAFKEVVRVLLFFRFDQVSWAAGIIGTQRQAADLRGACAVACK